MDIDAFSDQLIDLGIKGKGDRAKLMGLYAFNAFYNADKERLDDVLEGIVDAPNYPITGIYLNDKLEEDTVEVDIAYCPTDAPSFKLQEVRKLISNASYIIENVKKRVFASGNEKAESVLSDYLHPEEGEVPPFLIRVLTNVDLGESKEWDTRGVIEGTNVGVKGLRVSCQISFGHDIENDIGSNKAPFDSVADGFLLVDDPANKMSYGDNSIVVSVSAKSLKALWKSDGNKGLLAMNLRYYIKSGTIDGKIQDTIADCPSDFWYLNNGIIIVCDSFGFIGNRLKMTNFSIVNGGQTTRMIGEMPFDEDFYLLAKVIRVSGNKEEKNLFVSRVAEASNTQKPIKAKDIIANRVEQRNLKSTLADFGIALEIKRGEKTAKASFPEAWQRSKNNELAQDIYAFVFLEPGPARNNVSKILQDESKYALIFQKHTYEPLFIKNLLFLEKAYRKYASQIKKRSDETDPVKKGLVNNGMYYCLAVIGYILKAVYCKAFVDESRRLKGTSRKADIQGEQAFDHPFIDEGVSYGEFQKKAVDIFDNVISYIIKPVFDSCRAEKPELSYSNWTKTNTGFYSIVNRLEASYLEAKDDYLIKLVGKSFAKISEEQMEKDDKLFEVNVKANEDDNRAAKDDLDNSAKQIIDELMVLRLEYSKKEKISEKKLLTDKMIEKVAFQKPTTPSALRKIVSDMASYYMTEAILEVVLKYSH